MESSRAGPKMVHVKVHWLAGPEEVCQEPLWFMIVGGKKKKKKKKEKENEKEKENHGNP